MRLNALSFVVCLLFLDILTHAQVQNKGVIVSNNMNNIQPVKGKTFAVIVGIDNYQSKKIHPLYYAVADAKAFEEFLKSKAGGEIPEENIRHFFNDSAKTALFKPNGLRWVNSVAKDSDRVYLYFSGHGLTVSGGNSFLLANNFLSDFPVEMFSEAGTQSLYELKTLTIQPLVNKEFRLFL